MVIATNLYKQPNLKVSHALAQRRAEARQRKAEASSLAPEESYVSHGPSSEATIKSLAKPSQSKSVADFTPEQLDSLIQLKSSPAKEAVQDWMKFGLKNPTHLKMAFEQMTQAPNAASRPAQGILRTGRVALATSKKLEKSEQRSASLLGSAVSLGHLGGASLNKDSVGQAALDLLALSQQSERNHLGKCHSDQIVESGLKTMRSIVLSQADMDLKLDYPSQNQAPILSLAELASWKDPNGTSQSLFPHLGADHDLLILEELVEPQFTHHSLPPSGSSQPVKASLFQRLTGAPKYAPVTSPILQEYASDIAQGSDSFVSIEGTDVLDKDRYALFRGVSERAWARTENNLALEAPLLESKISKTLFADTTSLQQPGRRGAIMESVGFEAKTKASVGGLDFTIFQPAEAGAYQPAVVNMEAHPDSKQGDTTFFLSEFSKADSLLKAASETSLGEAAKVDLMLELSNRSHMVVYASPNNGPNANGSSFLGDGPAGLITMVHGEQNKACFRVHAAALLDKGLKDTWSLAFQQTKLDGAP